MTHNVTVHTLNSESDGHSKGHSAWMHVDTQWHSLDVHTSVYMNPTFLVSDKWGTVTFIQFDQHEHKAIDAYITQHQHGINWMMEITMQGQKLPYMRQIDVKDHLLDPDDPWYPDKVYGENNDDE